MCTHQRLWDTSLWSRLLAYSNSTGIVGTPKTRITFLPRRSYCLRDKAYLRLKVLTRMLDPI